MITKQQARTIIRKAVHRVPEGEEIRHLNIMPMMDMMTILLVTMIFQISSASVIVPADLNLATSLSQEEIPEEAIKLVISKSAILIEGNPLVAVTNGDVDSSEKDGGALGIRITRISAVLGGLRGIYDKERNDAGSVKPGDAPPAPELFIFADKSTPYRLLFAVIASARAEEAGFKRFRLIVADKNSAKSEE